MNRILYSMAAAVLMLSAICLSVVTPETSVQAAPPENYDKEKYKMALERFRTLTKERSQIEANVERYDPAYARSKEWCKNEQSGVTGQYRHKEKVFLEKLTEEHRKKYEQWKMVMPLLLIPEINESEWQKHPSSHKAILFFYENAEKTAENVSIPLPEGDDVTKFRLFLESTRKQLAAYSTDMDITAIEKDLNIPSDLKDEIVKDYKNSALFNLYAVYMHAHTPKELEEAKHDLRTAISELNTIRPGWEQIEGIEFKNEEFGFPVTFRSSFLRKIMFFAGLLLICAVAVTLVWYYFQGRKKL